MRSWSRLATLCAAILASGCLGAVKGTTPRLTKAIGPEGGSLAIGYGELALTVPAGALRETHEFGVAAAEAAPLATLVPAGLAYRFTPAGVQFAIPAQITLPFSPAKVSTAVTSAEIRIGFRDERGLVSTLVPSQVDSNRATCDVSTLGVFWVVAPDVVAADDMFPLHAGDVYRFASGLVLRVERTFVEPNLAPSEVAKVTLTRTVRPFGLYFDDSSHQLAKLGEFEAGQWQEIFTSPVPLLSERDHLGTSRGIIRTCTGHIPFGSPQVSYEHLIETRTEVAERLRLSTPLGAFDTVHVPIRTILPIPEAGSLIEFWFAAGVGPVAIRFDDSHGRDPLVEATVAGVPVRGN